jgi:hydrogenase maturation protease
VSKAVAPRLLVAGIGNVFLGDDGFGVEVVSRLSRRPQPEGVEVADFGIRGFDLAYALMEGYQAAVLVDALPRGGQPGDLFVVEPDLERLEKLEGPAVADAHGMDPVAVLKMVKQFGGTPPRLYVIGCQPASLGGEQGEMGLSPPVEAALDGAVELVEDVVRRLLAPVEAELQREVG